MLTAKEKDRLRILGMQLREIAELDIQKERKKLWRAWADMFPRLYYGCCEQLDNKVEELGTLSSLQKVSMSPFTKHREMMEAVGDKYVISFKPNNLYMAGDVFHVEKLKQEVIDVCKYARDNNCHVEIIMKSILHLNREPKRLWDWCEMASDIANNY